MIFKVPTQITPWQLVIHDLIGACHCSAFPFCLLCRPCDENHPDVKPDAYVNNLAEAVDIILQQM